MFIKCDHTYCDIEQSYCDSLERFFFFSFLLCCIIKLLKNLVTSLKRQAIGMNIIVVIALV